MVKKFQVFFVTNGILNFFAFGASVHNPPYLSLNYTGGQGRLALRFFANALLALRPSGYHSHRRYSKESKTLTFGQYYHRPEYQTENPFHFESP